MANEDNPAKAQLEHALELMGNHASPEIQKMIRDAIASLDPTDPRTVLELLPADVIRFYQHTLARGVNLVPRIRRSHDAGCFIESIILDHGLIQFSLRGLYVLAWQRAIMPHALSDHELAPFYRQRSRQADVFSLINALEANGLLQGKEHADHLRMVNDVRNRAAHGVIFGEIHDAELESASKKCQRAALGALETLKAWFNNPRPLTILPSQSLPRFQ